MIARTKHRTVLPRSQACSQTPSWTINIWQMRHGAAPRQWGRLNPTRKRQHARFKCYNYALYGPMSLLFSSTISITETMIFGKLNKYDTIRYHDFTGRYKGRTKQIDLQSTLCLKKRVNFGKHALILTILGKQHQQTFKNDMRIQLSLSFHFCIFKFR